MHGFQYLIFYFQVIVNILKIGFFLAYVHRFDRLKKTFVYEIVSFFGLLVGLILWVIV